MGNRSTRCVESLRKSTLEDVAPLPDEVSTVAIVTGGGTGVGKALALALAAAGHHVVIVGRRLDALNSVAAEAPGKIFACPADVGTQEGRNGIAAFVGKRPVSVLVNNAAMCGISPVTSIALESFQSEMRVNVEGPVFLTQALIENLKAYTEKARVLMIGSGAADMHLPTMGCYCMTKAAMKMGWMALRDELKDDVAVGYCLPGLVLTEITTEHQLKNEKFALKDFIAGRVESGDIHPAAEVAEWIVALLDAKLCNDEVFAQQEHNIDKVDHQLGVKVTLTMEGKLLQGQA
jgi:NAD(P)-dependent dehydrogenase (short-subunit alcohol dehydrogenase family)